MKALFMITAWLPLVLPLLSLVGIFGTISLVLKLRDTHRLVVEAARTKWALELLQGYDEAEVRTELQRWGVKEAINHGLMPARLTLRCWERTGQDPHELRLQLQARLTLLAHHEKPKQHFTLVRVLTPRRSHA